MFNSTSMPIEELLASAGQRLREQRVKRRLRLQDLSDMTGVSANTIRLMECGHDCRLSTWTTLQRVLDPSAIESLYFPDAKIPSTPLEDVERLKGKAVLRVRQKSTLKKSH